MMSTPTLRVNTTMIDRDMMIIDVSRYETVGMIESSAELARESAPYLRSSLQDHVDVVTIVAIPASAVWSE